MNTDLTLHCLCVCVYLFPVAGADVVVGELLMVIILVEKVLQGLLLLVFAELKETSMSIREKKRW